MPAPDFQNPRAAWWTPRRFTGLMAAGLAIGVVFVLDGIFGWTRSPDVVGVLGGVTILCVMVLFGSIVNKQGWRWLLRADNSTTRWQV